MTAPQDPPLAEIRAVKKHFVLHPGLVSKWLFRRPDRVVKAVDGIDLKIEQGEVVGLVGESGCGKSTLGRVIAHLDDPTEGELRFDGRQVRNGIVVPNDTSVDEAISYSKLCQVIFQNPYSSLNPRKTVRDIIGAPAIGCQRVVVLLLIRSGPVESVVARWRQCQRPPEDSATSSTIRTPSNVIVATRQVACEKPSPDSIGG